MLSLLTPVHSVLQVTGSHSPWCLPFPHVAASPLLLPSVHFLVSLLAHPDTDLLFHWEAPPLTAGGEDGVGGGWMGALI